MNGREKYQHVFKNLDSRRGITRVGPQPSQPSKASMVLQRALQEAQSAPSIGVAHQHGRSSQTSQSSKRPLQDMPDLTGIEEREETNQALYDSMARLGSDMDTLAQTIQVITSRINSIYTAVKELQDFVTGEARHGNDSMVQAIRDLHVVLGQLTRGEVGDDNALETVDPRFLSTS